MSATCNFFTLAPIYITSRLYWFFVFTLGVFISFLFLVTNEQRALFLYQMALSKHALIGSAVLFNSFVALLGLTALLFNIKKLHARVYEIAKLFLSPIYGFLGVSIGVIFGSIIYAQFDPKFYSLTFIIAYALIFPIAILYFAFIAFDAISYQSKMGSGWRKKVFIVLWTFTLVSNAWLIFAVL